MNPTVLDDATASTIRRALAEAQAGRLADACAVGEEGLRSGGDAGALHALLGMLHSHRKAPEQALEHLRRANAARPQDPAIASNLASALIEQGEHEQALAVAAPDLASTDRTSRLWRLRGFAAQSLGRFEEAVEAYRRVVESTPDDWESWNNLGNSLSATGQLQEAVSALRQSVELEPAAAPTRLNLARALLDAGREEEATQVLNGAAADFPDDPVPWQELHALARANGRDDEALASLTEAVRRSPSDPALWIALGHEHGSRLEMPEAEQAYQRAVDLDPSNAEAHVGLAMVFEHEVREKDLDQLATLAAQRGVSEAQRHLIEAVSLCRHKRFDEALRKLASVPAEVEPIRRAQLLGQAHDGLGQAAEAFAAYREMNELVAQDPSNPANRAAQMRERLRHEMAFISAEWRRNWTTLDTSGERPSPVFLVGFPRSGTTLLDTLLMGHPDVEVLEERPTLPVVDRLIGGVEALASMDDDQLRQARQAYFTEAGRHTALAPGKLLVDKSPLFMNRLPLIMRLFPDAKIILALRHPADVVLSCFVSNFRPNPAMANFLQLETAAEFYDLSFSYWEKARALLTPAVHEVRYERMVTDAEGELRPLIEWVGLDWREQLLDHRKTAAQRGLITTASYAQVREPLYQRSMGRWQRYREQLAPVLPILQPWAERFGYELTP